MTLDANRQPRPHVAVDIGSTVVKIARVGMHDELIEQEFYPRDFRAGIVRQVESLLDASGASADRSEVLVCSSANGGLRVGIVCLTKHFSGAALRNEALLAGANPVFVQVLGENDGHPSYVDLLLVGGGIDCPDAAPLEQRLRRFAPEKYRYGALLYAGNKYLADSFLARFSNAILVPNPLAEQLVSKTSTVFEVVRRAYLDDLVYKEGVSELSGNLAIGIRPTPEIVNLGFRRALLHRSSIALGAPCVLLDMGGATTDLHYTIEIVSEDSKDKPSAGSSVARYVFTDLGIVASRDTLLLQLRSHPRLHDFLSRALPKDIRGVYQLLREGEYEPSLELLSYGCLFLALDRFAQGRGPGLPAGNLAKIAQVVLTGGAAQHLSEDVVARVIDLLLPEGTSKPGIMIDRRYQVWVDGIVWAEHPSSD